MKTTFKIILLCVCLSNFKIAYGQKRNEIQTGNLWLNNVKIDGKLTEWQLPLAALNKATHIQYSIANDDKNLYLAVQTNRVGKLESGGLTLVVNGSSITFPYNKRRDRRKKENLGPFKPGEPIRLEDFKEIHIANIKSINDSLMSIYNPYGIRASGVRYEKNGERLCEYEMAIPLKFLGLSAANEVINYTVRLNGIIPTNPGGPGGTSVPIPGKSQREMMELEERMLDLVRVKQLSGKYVLAQKR